MADYVVTKSEINKYGFGNVLVVGGENLHAKGKYGFSTGKKGMPSCVAGDNITADIGSNAKGYPEIKNIVVTGKAPANAMPVMPGAKKGGSEFRTPDQIMRTTAIEYTVANSDTPLSVEEIMMFADELFMYIKDGTSPVAVNQIGDNSDDSDIPF